MCEQMTEVSSRKHYTTEIANDLMSISNILFDEQVINDKDKLMQIINLVKKWHEMVAVRRDPDLLYQKNKGQIILRQTQHGTQQYYCEICNKHMQLRYRPVHNATQRHKRLSSKKQQGPTDVKDEQ